MAASMAWIFLARAARSTTTGCRPPPVRHFREGIFFLLGAGEAPLGAVTRKTFPRSADGFLEVFRGIDVGTSTTVVEGGASSRSGPVLCWGRCKSWTFAKVGESLSEESSGDDSLGTCASRSVLDTCDRAVDCVCFFS
jgi:hypothetical protein